MPPEDELMPEFHRFDGRSSPTFVAEQGLPPVVDGHSTARILDYFLLYFTEETIDQFLRGSNNHVVLRGVRN